MTGELQKIVDLAPSIIDLYEKTHKEYESFGKGWNLYSALLALYGFSMGGLGYFEKGQVLLEKALNFASGINDLISMGLIEAQYSAFYTMKGDGENTIRHAANAIKYGDEAQVVPFSSTGRNMAGFGYYFIGESRTGETYAKQALELQLNIGMTQNLSVIYHCLGTLQLERGDLENARGSAEEAIRWARDNGERMHEARARTLYGTVLVKMSSAQYEEAEEHILQGIRIAEELKLKPVASQAYLSLGELYADTGQREKALEALKKAESMMQEMGMDYWLRRTQEVLERVEGKI
jgi:tetratricopeptide (TPR) repeat protein